MRSMLVYLAASVLLSTGAYAGDAGSSAPVAAEAHPDATVTLKGGSVAAGIGYTWGDGELTYRETSHQFSIKGVSVVDVGATDFTAAGNVYNLKDLADFAGNYVATGAGITVAGGGTAVYLKNEHGVVIKLISADVGVKFNLSADGVHVALKSADAAADLAAIHAVDDVWVESFNNTRDVDTMAALYDEHAVLLPPGAPAARGQAAIRSFFVNMMPEATKDGLVFTLGSNPAGGAHGDMGWSSGTYTVKDKTGHVIDTGKYLSVSRKRDGKWLYIRDMWNSDGPPASKESAPQPKK